MGPDQYKNEKWDPDPNQNISNPPHWLCLHNSFTVQITKKNFFHILLQLFLGQFATIFLDDPSLSFLLNYLFYIFVLFFFTGMCTGLCATCSTCWATRQPSYTPWPRSSSMKVAHLAQSSRQDSSSAGLYASPATRHGAYHQVWKWRKWRRVLDNPLHLLDYTPAQLHAMAHITKYESGASGAEF